ncbi:uncharacterized protein LOC135392506 [Ornithodoros turicata]|uniref:uncharacterized protein LOC135392506 n=1 Tax=Ornithodoros turicata TaxID=34597 RepID=UPI003138C194
MASTQEVVEGVERQGTAETQEPSEEHGATESNKEDEPIGSFPGTLEELPTVAATESVKECACTEKIAQLEKELAAAKASEMAMKVELDHLELKLKDQTSEINMLRCELATAQANLLQREEVSPFGIEQFKENDEDIQFYTGLPSYNHFLSLLEFLDPGENGKNVRRNEGASSLPNSEQAGRPQKVSVENRLFLVLVKLRLGVFHRHLGHLFGVSVSTVSRIFSTWVDFIYLQLGQLPLCLSRQAVDESMPLAFQDMYPSTRVILDATEIKCDVPTSFVTQSGLYSHYKSAHTFKGLVGISPNGTVTFVSELFTGSTSDRECVLKSGFLRLPFDVGDSIMADKGFRIADLLHSKGVALNIPPFLVRDQFTPEEVQETQNIAALRIHVERRIQRIKGYHVFDRPIPISLVPLANQMWTICTILTNFQAPLLKDVCCGD